MVCPGQPPLGQGKQVAVSRSIVQRHMCRVPSATCVVPSSFPSLLEIMDGKFSTKSTYDHLSSDDEGNNFKYIWKAKIPYKIKKFHVALGEWCCPNYR
jgi:hypothetical protein